jgi:hypothetical protein
MYAFGKWMQLCSIFENKSTPKYPTYETTFLLQSPKTIAGIVFYATASIIIIPSINQ